jgi:hypothetical protein
MNREYVGVMVVQMARKIGKLKSDKGWGSYRDKIKIARKRSQSTTTSSSAHASNPTYGIGIRNKLDMSRSINLKELTREKGLG